MTDQNYEDFIEGVLTGNQVWGLQQSDGDWAIVDSIEYEEVLVYIFWSEKAEAQKHCTEDWKNYKAVAVDLVDFLDNWLPGMHEDGYLVGPNWNDDLSGDEMEPAEVAAALGRD